jgi:hypothetical protein
MRFVRRYGFGIQSPWAYSFVKDVLYEKLRFYAYDDLLLQFPGRKDNVIRRDEQLFRLVNFFKPEEIIVLGGCCPCSMKYMQAASKSAKVIDTDTICLSDIAHLSDSQLPSATFMHIESATFIYIEKELHPSDIDAIIALKNSDPNYLWTLVIDGINKENRPLWQHLKATSFHAVLFDMKYRGVAFFDSHRIGQCYRI